MDSMMIPVLGIVFSLFVAPALVFGFILLIRKGKHDVEKLQLQKEMKEIELRREEVHLQTLIEENKKYDRLIGGSSNGGDA
jgi:hypothetical protein